MGKGKQEARGSAKKSRLKRDKKVSDKSKKIKRQSDSGFLGLSLGGFLQVKAPKYIASGPYEVRPL